MRVHVTIPLIIVPHVLLVPRFATSRLAARQQISSVNTPSPTWSDRAARALLAPLHLLFVPALVAANLWCSRGSVCVSGAIQYAAGKQYARETRADHRRDDEQPELR